MSPPEPKMPQIPDLGGKVILITGGTAGVGAQSVVHLAQHNPTHIYFTGRNATGADAVIKEVAQTGSNTVVRFLQCDLTSLGSVAAAAEKILSEQSRLDVLMANAGIMNHPPKLTEDGYELHFGINYLSHALFIRKLMPLLEQTAAQPGADVRIIMLTSSAFRSGGIAFDELKTVQDNFKIMGGIYRYGQSKLADLLIAKELSRRYPSITSVSVTPGIVNTDLAKSQKGMVYALTWLSARTTQGGFIKLEHGAYSQLWCVGAPKADIQNGAFYEPVGVLSKMSSKYSKDDNLSKELWDWTQTELEQW